MDAARQNEDNTATVAAKSLVTRTKNHAWFGSDYNMNLYRGCTHGCIYCDSRSDCYRNPEFEYIKKKENAVALLEKELSGKKERGVIATGSMSDPYNELEASERLTQQALQLIRRYGYGVAIATKGALVARDAALLADIAKQAPVIVKITITCADDQTGKKIEENAPLSSQRFAALRELTDANIFAGVLLMPVMPYINDTAENIAAIVRQAKAAGASFVFAGMGLTIRGGQRQYLYQKLDRHYPGLKEQYIRRYGDDYQCPAPRAGALRRKFVEACRQNGVLYEMEEIVAAYRGKHDTKQARLF